MRFELIGVKDDVCRRNPGQVVFYGERILLVEL